MVKRKKRERAGSTKRDSSNKSQSSTFAIPEGVELFQPEAKKYNLDILLYEVGEGNPEADQGKWHYCRPFWAHRNVGPNNRFRICPAKTAGKRCPICEEMARLSRDEDVEEDRWRPLIPSKRELWLVFDRDEEDKGAQLFESSRYAFGELLDQRRNDADEDEEHIREFDDPEAGSTLRVTFRKESYGAGSFIKANAIDFRPRRNGLDNDLLDHGICLDDLLIIPEYDQLKKEFFMEDYEQSESKEEEPVTAQELGLEKGMFVMMDGEKYKIQRISRDGTSLTLVDKEGTKVMGVAPDDVDPAEDDSDEEFEEKPKEKTRTKSQEPDPEPEGKDDDDDDWGDWDDD